MKTLGADQHHTRFQDGHTGTGRPCDPDLNNLPDEQSCKLFLQLSIIPPPQSTPKIGTMASNVSTKFSILACQAMQKSARKRKGHEQKTKVDDFRRGFLPQASQEEMDRIQRLAEQEVAFQRKMAATAKALKAKQAAWKKAAADHGHSDSSAQQQQQQCSTWTVDPRGWEEQQSGLEDPLVETDCWETGSTLDAPCQEVLSAPSEEIQGPPIWGRDPTQDWTTWNNPSWGDEAQPSDEVYYDGSSSDRDGNGSDQDFSYADEEAIPTLARCDVRILSGEQLDQVTDADPQEGSTDAAAAAAEGWALPAWCLEDQTATPSTTDQPVDMAETGDSSDTAPCSTAQAVDEGREEEEPQATTEHLALANLLIDEQWDDFMAWWSARNARARQGPRQRFSAWFEHRRLRPVAVREAEEAARQRARSRVPSAYAVVCGGVLQSHQEASSRKQHHQPGPTRSSEEDDDFLSSRLQLECHCQGAGSTASSNTRCPWAESNTIKKSRLCKSHLGGCAHSSTLCTVSEVQD